MFTCFSTTGCEACSFTTDGSGIFNVSAHLGACRTHEGRSGTNTPAPELTRRDRNKLVFHPAPAEGSNPECWGPEFRGCDRWAWSHVTPLLSWTRPPPPLRPPRLHRVCNVSPPPPPPPPPPPITTPPPRGLHVHTESATSPPPPHHHPATLTPSRHSDTTCHFRSRPATNPLTSLRPLGADGRDVMTGPNDDYYWVVSRQLELSPHLLSLLRSVCPGRPAEEGSSRKAASQKPSCRAAHQDSAG